MKQFIQFGLLFGTVLLFTGTQMIPGPYGSSTSNYCNSRFDFCVDYPPALLPEQNVSVNDDGVILKTSDHLTTASVSGSYNILQWTPKELFSFTVNDLSGKGENIRVISSVFGDDFYETYFINGNISYYHRAYFLKDYYIQLIINAPVNQPELMARLKEEVVVQFEPEG